MHEKQDEASIHGDGVKYRHPSLLTTNGSQLMVEIPNVIGFELREKSGDGVYRICFFGCSLFVISYQNLNKKHVYKTIRVLAADKVCCKSGTKHM